MNPTTFFQENITEIAQAVLLGIVQGASEFLPISSSGHLFIIPKVLGWEGVLNSLSFDVALHLGTTLAVLAYFWRDWLLLLTTFLKTLPKGLGAVWDNTNSRLFIFLIVGSLPAAAIGYLFQDFFTEEARNLPLVGINLIFFGGLLFLGDRLGKQEKSLQKITFTDSLSIGLAQCLALIPGVSRSGITITSGLFRGLNRESATKFSFLLSTPAIVGATILESGNIVSGLSKGSSQPIFLFGLISAAISGFLAIKLLLRFIQNNNFNIFVIYRVLLGLGVLAIAIGI